MQRFLVGLFTIVFCLLFYWLLGFVVRDIATWPGPVYADIERKVLDPGLADKEVALRSQLEEVNRTIKEQRDRQQVLRDSTSNSELTMNRMLEIQKLSLEKGIASTAAERDALVKSREVFLANQAQYQRINEDVSRLSEEARRLEAEQRNVTKELNTHRPRVQQEYQVLYERHQLKLAGAKLAFLLPLLAAAVFLFVKKRAGLYAPLIYAFGLAVLVKATMVMHEHFPTRYFKYVLLLVAIGLVAAVLIHLLRSIAFPKSEDLLKQYREAYERFLCPVCAFPARRGPLKYLFWTRRSVTKLRVPPSSGGAEDEPYSCPACGTRLFEVCASCQTIRPSLLPTCPKCGGHKDISTPSTP